MYVYTKASIVWNKLKDTEPRRGKSNRENSPQQQQHTHTQKEKKNQE